MKLVLMAMLVLSFSSAHAGVKIEACEKVAGRIAARMFIGNLKMSLTDVTIKTQSEELENSDNAFRVTVREKGNEEHMEIVDSNYIVKTDLGQNGLCEILSITKVSR